MFKATLTKLETEEVIDSVSSDNPEFILRWVRLQVPSFSYPELKPGMFDVDGVYLLTVEDLTPQPEPKPVAKTPVKGKE